MKAAFAFCVFFLAAVALARPDGDTYTDRWNNIDVKEIMCNKKLLTNYHKCLLEEGQCPPDAKELKAHLPDALQNGCAKCTDKQKEASEYVIGYLVHNELEMWKELVAKYDPNNEYSTKYSDRLEKAPKPTCD